MKIFVFLVLVFMISMPLHAQLGAPAYEMADRAEKKADQALRELVLLRKQLKSINEAVNKLQKSIDLINKQVQKAETSKPQIQKKK